VGVDNHEESVSARSRSLFEQLRSRRSGRHRPGAAGDPEGGGPEHADDGAVGPEPGPAPVEAPTAATTGAAPATEGAGRDQTRAVAEGDAPPGTRATARLDASAGAAGDPVPDAPGGGEAAGNPVRDAQGGGEAGGEPAAGRAPERAPGEPAVLGASLAATDLEALGVAGNGDGALQPAPDRHPAADLPLPRIVAIANQKGGVGKTTTAVNLGAALAELGFRTLIVDLDPQGNATTGLGVNPRNLEHSIYDVLMRELPIDECVEPTSVRNLFVAPATIDLAGAEIELVPAFSRELRLRRALGEVADDYDFTIIDCPPSLGLLTVNGLAAAGEVIVPIQCEYYALEGLSQLLRNVNLVKGNLNPALNVSAIILTMYDARTKLADQVAAEVRKHFGPKVCRNVVPRTVRLSEAPSFGQPITVFDPASRGALAYRELAKEVSGGAPQRVG
jgi:chromosome partitioning protein